MITTIKTKDFIQSIADAFQYISYYHPKDYIEALAAAYYAEKSPAAKDAIAQILSNSRMCAEGKRPICQDTGICVVFLKIGMEIAWDINTEGENKVSSTYMSIEDMVNAGVRCAYLNPDNKLRGSIVSDPAGLRKNTQDNTPAVIHYELVPGNKLEVICAAKGGGSENKSRLAILNPSDSVVDWVIKTLPEMGAGWCPPGMLGIGIGGTPEKAMLLAKKALMAPIDIQKLIATGPNNKIEELRLEIYSKANALGIGAQGLGGLSTVLDVKILDYPTHAASLPVGLIPNCAATRHVHFELDGSGPCKLPIPSLSSWPKIYWTPSQDSKRVNLENLNRAEVSSWQPGQTLLLSGKILTGRDAAHKKIQNVLSGLSTELDGLDFKNKIIYYVGPVDPVRDEIVGPAGPTTATRMDQFTEMMLGQLGLLAMIGKAERGNAAIEVIKKYQGAYLIAVGGAAYLVSQAIRSAKVVAFANLGMEAIYEFEIKDMPVTVAVDARGVSIHKTGPEYWKQYAKIHWKILD